MTPLRMLATTRSKVPELRQERGVGDAPPPGATRLRHPVALEVLARVQVGVGVALHRPAPRRRPGARRRWRGSAEPEPTSSTRSPGCERAVEQAQAAAGGGVLAGAEGHLRVDVDHHLPRPRASHSVQLGFTTRRSLTRRGCRPRFHSRAQSSSACQRQESSGASSPRESSRRGSARACGDGTPPGPRAGGGRWSARRAPPGPRGRRASERAPRRAARAAGRRRAAGRYSTSQRRGRAHAVKRLLHLVPEAGRCGPSWPGRIPSSSASWRKSSSCSALSSARGPDLDAHVLVAAAAAAQVRQALAAQREHVAALGTRRARVTGSLPCTVGTSTSAPSAAWLKETASTWMRSSPSRTKRGSSSTSRITSTSPRGPPRGPTFPWPRRVM